MIAQNLDRKLLLLDLDEFLRKKIQRNLSEMGKRSVGGRFNVKNETIKLTVPLNFFAKFIH